MEMFLGSQKNRLKETVLLSTPQKRFKLMMSKKELAIFRPNLCLSRPTKAFGVSVKQFGFRSDLADLIGSKLFTKVISRQH